MRPNLPAVLLSRRTKIVLAVVVVIVVLLIVLVQLSGVYVNYLWYDSVQHRNVYSTMLWTKVSLFFIFGALMALIIGGNMLLAYLIRPPFRPMSPEQQNLQNYAVMLEPRRRLILIGVALIAFLAAGASAQGNWQMWQLWLHGGSFGITDPQFHQDISFYAWDYPVYRSLLGFGFTGVIFALVLAVIVHYLTGAIRLQTPGPKMTITARRHVTVLVFTFMALKAIAYWLDRYGLVFSNRSKFTGASYTDVHAELPAKTILFWIAIILAIGVLASMWLRSALLPGIGFVVLLVLSILIGGIYPAILQSVSVKPNASDKERPYIARNISATRRAYGIATESKQDPAGTVSYVKYQASETPSVSALSASNTTVNNIRILDPNVISPTFTNQQKIAFPYDFAPRLNVDRYNIGGQTHDYIVGVRQLDPRNIAAAGVNNWINQYTVYTHGYGFVAAQADTDVTNGAPYTEYDIPPTGPLGLKQPDVYFGPGMNPYAIVGAKDGHREYDGNGRKTANVTYQGGGGVSLSSWFTRAAFALRYKETNFLLNNVVSAPNAHVILNRDPAQMVHKIAPFLTIDGSPYPIVDQQSGHIVWMVDGYTTMANYPYSERQSLSALTGTALRQDQANTQINYIRNSVKATVDAYTGKVTLYAWGQSQQKDPILQAWESIFPGLVKNEKAMPAAIKDHVRYPQDLFNVQRALLGQYHITNPVASYNGRGKWGVPIDPNQRTGSQPPYYILADQPGQSSNKPVFQLTSPMTVTNANNVAAYISADCGPNDYGHLTVLKVPSNTNVAGPVQVANAFRSNPTVSHDISLFNQQSGQSRVVHGNLLTLPVGNSFLYVEPLYVRAAYPILARVITYFGGHIGYEATLNDSLNDLRLGRSAGTLVNSENGAGQTGTSSPPSSPQAPETPPHSTSAPPTGTISVPANQVQLLQQINTDFKRSQRAYANGNYRAGAIGQADAQQLIEQYLRTYGALPVSGSGSTTGTTTPTTSASPSRGG
jgi:uncharacterized membrane protein (UPF0182 family)